MTVGKIKRTDVLSGYFNWAGQSPLSEPVRKSIKENQEALNRLPFCNDNDINLLQSRVEFSRSLLAEWFHIRHKEGIVFATGAVHALDIALKTICPEGGMQVYLTSEEFPEVINCVKWYNNSIEFVEFPDFENQIEAKLIDGKQSLFVLSHISYRTGCELNIENTVRIIRKLSPGSIIIIDASQAVGNIESFNLYRDTDAVIFNTNKWLQGPCCGVLVLVNNKLINSVRNGIFCSFSSALPFSSEMCSTSGLNLVYTASLMTSLNNFQKEFSNKEYLRQKRGVRDSLICKLQDKTGAKMLRTDFTGSDSGIVSFTIPAMLEEMGYEIYKNAIRRGIFFRLFSDSGNNNQLPVFRFSVHWYNNMENVEELVDLLKL